MKKSPNWIAVLNSDCLKILDTHSEIAIAVSGGADSMALVHILHAAFPDKKLFAYTVDHALRPESSAEAQEVQRWLSPICTHRILTWQHAVKPNTGIQENARNARYELLKAACVKDGVSVLCTGHHADDQAETILHRLAKGSGIDGLAGMKTISILAEDLTLLRPLLHVTHDELVSYCFARRIEWVEDLSNENEKFARVRLRKSRDVLAEEGLTSERLSRLGERMARTADALNYYTDKEWDVLLVGKTPDKITLDNKALGLPTDIITRLVLKAADHLGHGADLRGNLKRLEEFVAAKQPRKRISLSHMILTLDDAKGLSVEREAV